MNESLSIAPDEMLALIALVLTAMGLMGAYAGFLLTRTSRSVGRAHDRVDEVHERIDRTRESYVSHRMLNGQLKRIDEKIEGLHRHFAERAVALKEQHERLQQSLDQVHERIDDLMQARAVAPPS